MGSWIEVKRVIPVTLVALIGLAGGMGAGVAENASSVKEASAPQIIFSETSHDFGTVGMGPEASHVFTFRNGGGAELRLLPPRAS